MTMNRTFLYKLLQLFDFAIKCPLSHSGESDLYFGSVEGARDPGSISARIHFDGDPSGEFELTLTRGAARQFATSFLAVDEPDLPPDADAEVTCELANMICGAALSRVHPDSVVRLNAPYICDAVAPLEGVRQRFETPEGVLSITMRVN